MDDIDKTYLALKRVTFSQLVGLNSDDKASIVLALRRQGWTLTDYLVYDVSDRMQIMTKEQFSNTDDTPIEDYFPNYSKYRIYPDHEFEEAERQHYIKYWDALSNEELEEREEEE